MFQQCREKLAAGRPLAAGIVTGTTGVMAAIPAVEQGVGRAGIKAIDAVCLARQHRDIGDAAEVEHHPQGAGAGKEGLMEGGHQWRPLTAEGHVHGAKVGHHIDAGQRRQQGRVADLQGKAELGAVADGLAVAAEGTNIFGVSPALASRAWVAAANSRATRLSATPMRSISLSPGVQRACSLWAVSAGRVAQRRLYSKRFPIHRHQHGVDTIHAGTGHQAYIAFSHQASLLAGRKKYVREGAASIPCRILVPGITPI